MNTKTLRNLFNVFTEIVETNPADEVEFNLYYVHNYVYIPCPDGYEDVETYPATLKDGSLALGIQWLHFDYEDEANNYTRNTILKPDYSTGRMVMA